MAWSTSMSDNMIPGDSRKDGPSLKTVAPIFLFGTHIEHAFAPRNGKPPEGFCPLRDHVLCQVKVFQPSRGGFGEFEPTHDCLEIQSRRTSKPQNRRQVETEGPQRFKTELLRHLGYVRYDSDSGRERAPDVRARARHTDIGRTLIGAWDAPGSNGSRRRCAHGWNAALGDVGFEADCGLKPDIAPSSKSARNGLTQHCGRPHLDYQDRRRRRRTMPVLEPTPDGPCPLQSIIIAA
jgi:hypothetical protein